MWLEVGKQSVPLIVPLVDTRPTMWLEIREQCGEQNLWLGTRPTMWLEIEIRVLDLESLMCVLFGCLSETDSYKTS